MGEWAQVAIQPNGAPEGNAREPLSATIANPILNSPFKEPDRHFVVVDGQVSGGIEPRRRPSEFFVPVAKPKKASPQLALQFGSGIRQQPNEIVNEVRQAVGRWRLQGYPHTTAVTRELLAHWRADDRERRLLVGVEEPSGDVVDRGRADFACGRVVDVETVDLDLQLAVGGLRDPYVGLAEDREQVAGASLLTTATPSSSATPTSRAPTTPNDKLRRALRADISDDAWSTINSTVSRPFPRPPTDKIAIKVINHYGDEVMKVLAGA